MSFSELWLNVNAVSLVIKPKSIIIIRVILLNLY